MSHTPRPPTSPLTNVLGMLGCGVWFTLACALTFLAVALILTATRSH